MNKKYSGPYADRLYEIDRRVAELKIQMDMWSKAGAPGGANLLVIREIRSLGEEKGRILRGTQSEYESMQKKIDELKKMREECLFINFVRRKRLDKELDYYEMEKSKIR